MVTGKQMANKLRKAGFDMKKVLEVGKNDIEVKDERAQKKAAKILGIVGACKTGYGSWIISQKIEDKGDYCSTASKWHY